MLMNHQCNKGIARDVYEERNKYSTGTQRHINAQLEWFSNLQLQMESKFCPDELIYTHNVF